MILALLACWGNGRNHPNSGNPELETLRGSCTTSGWTVRLYEGDGGATVAWWSSVTVERPDLPERQVLHAYAFPLFTHVLCSPSSVSLRGADGVHHELPVDTLGQARSEPIRFWRGERR